MLDPLLERERKKENSMKPPLQHKEKKNQSTIKKKYIIYISKHK